MGDDLATCTRCGQPLERGSVYSTRWVRWLPEGRKAPLGYGQFDDDELIGMSGWSRPKTAAATRCTRCRVVELHY